MAYGAYMKKEGFILHRQQPMQQILQQQNISLMQIRELGTEHQHQLAPVAAL